MEPIIFLQTHIDQYLNKESIPVIRIFGISKLGKPVISHITGFLPYVYVEYHNELVFKNELFLKDFKEEFNKQFNKARLVSLEPIYKQSIYGYTNKKTLFAKITFNNPVLAAIKTFLEDGIYIEGQRYCFKVYESNIHYIMRFMIDRDIVGMCYMQIKEYNRVDETKYTELHAHIDSLSVIKSENEYAKLPPLKVLSFDIECIGEVGFPSAKKDPIIQIGNTFTVYGSDANEQDIFCLKETSPLPNARVHSFDKEKDLLESWYDYFMEKDPDIIIGYNIKGFDFPYIVDRFKALKKEEFLVLGRTNNKIKIRDQFISSRQLGSRNMKDIEIDGRLIFDLYEVIKKDFNLRSYTLNAVSVHFLHEQKEDVPYSIMKELQEKSPETRKRIASYCLKDSLLPLILFKQLNILYNYIELARVTGVPIEYISSRGQAIKVLSQILREAKKYGYIMPVVDGETGFEGGFVMEPIKGYYHNPICVLDFSSLYPSIMIVNNLCYTTLLQNQEYANIANKDNDKFSKDEENTLISNELSAENSEIFQLSDEPIILENIHQFSMSKDPQNTLLNKAQRVKRPKTIENPSDCDQNNSNLKQKTQENNKTSLYELQSNDVTKTPTNNYFVKGHIKKGLLPTILENLISERKKTKRLMNTEKDEELKASLNARQLALKISANSIYGFTGAPLGKLPCIEISQSTTSYGREMIANTKKLIEEKFNQKNDFSHNANVIYGDTDSVMIDFNDSDIKKVFEIGQEVARFVTGTFQKPIGLEFEKVFCPFLLMNKKRYAGLIYTQPNKSDKIETKGIETVRRDNCEMVRNVIETCLDMILLKKDIEAAKNYVKNTVKDLLMDNIDLSQLVISKSLTKENDKYLSKQAHVELALKLQKREEGSAPVLGDRVSYIIVKGPKNKPPSERSEDPVYVLENNLPVDTEYYLENQLTKPVYRLFEPIMNNVSVLIHGDHTKSKGTSHSSKGPLSGFVLKKVCCISCRTPGGILCKNCLKDYTKHFLDFQKNLNDKKEVFAKCWTECQRCQGSIISEVICVNRDCPIFYKRTKIKKEIVDLEEKYKTLKEFEW